MERSVPPFVSSDFSNDDCAKDCLSSFDYDVPPLVTVSSKSSSVNVRQQRQRGLRQSNAVSIMLLIVGIAIGACGTHSFVPSSLYQRSGRIVSSMNSAAIDNLEAILWDMDGVLADTERDAHRPAFNEVFKEKGLDTVWDVEQYGKLLEVGGGKERMTAHWNNVGWPTVYFSEDDDEVTRQEKVKALHLRKTDVFNDLIKQGGVPLRPGVLRIVDEAINKGIRLAVCSTSNEKAVQNLVNTLFGPERSGKFQIFAGDMVAKKKPAPDVYLLAVDTMGLDKSKCVIVEDSAIGLGAAKAAGIACIVTKSSYTRDEDFSGASMIVDKLGEDDGNNSCVSLETLAGLTTLSV